MAKSVLKVGLTQFKLGEVIELKRALRLRAAPTACERVTCMKFSVALENLIHEASGAESEVSSMSPLTGE
jgi:hypothetical protein